MASSYSLFGEYETKVKYISASWLGSPQSLPAYESYVSPLPPAQFNTLAPLCPRHCATVPLPGGVCIQFNMREDPAAAAAAAASEGMWHLCHTSTHTALQHTPTSRYVHPVAVLLIYTLSPHVHMCISYAFGSIALARISLANQHLINLTNAAKYFETRWARCCCSCYSPFYTHYA